MRILVLLAVLFTSRTIKASTPIKSLSLYNNIQNIALFDHERFRSSVPEHNIIPPHGSVVSDKFVMHMNQCGGHGSFTLCGENSFMGTDLKVTLYKDEKPIADRKFSGKFSDVFFRFLGSPSARVYYSVYFTDEKIGFLSSFGFTLYNGKQFCETVSLASNDAYSFGLTKENQIVLVGYGPKLEGSDRVDGWRIYDEAALCR